VCTLRPGCKANKTLVPLFITARQRIFLPGKLVLKRSRNPVKISGTSRQVSRAVRSCSATKPAERRAEAFWQFTKSDCKKLSATLADNSRQMLATSTGCVKRRFRPAHRQRNGGRAGGAIFRIRPCSTVRTTGRAPPLLQILYDVRALLFIQFLTEGLKAAKAVNPL